MKRITVLVLAFFMIFSLTACGNGSRQQGSDNGNNHSAGSSTVKKVSPNKKILIAYFSHTGNTREIAQQIHNKVGGDLFQIKTVKPYAKDYDVTVDRAKKEQDENARPKLTAKVKNMKDYDVVFLGYPDWWGTMPMAVFTFLGQYNFSGKTIIPFVTHEGSEFGRSLSDIRKTAPKAKLARGIAVRGSEVQSAQGDVSKWLRKLGMID
ncbi:MAG: flavodoxin [Sporolactobacillus sp.]